MPIIALIQGTSTINVNALIRHLQVNSYGGGLECITNSIMVSSLGLLPSCGYLPIMCSTFGEIYRKIFDLEFTHKTTHPDVKAIPQIMNRSSVCVDNSRIVEFFSRNFITYRDDSFTKCKCTRG